MLTLLFSTLAYAEEPQAFDPVVAEVVVEGKTLKGILIDEATSAELLRLRKLVKSQEEELQSFEEWKAKHDAIFTVALDTMRAEYVTNQDSLVTHYEGELRAAKRRDNLQRLGFPLGVIVGAAGMTGITIAVLHVYDTALPASIVGR